MPVLSSENKKWCIFRNENPFLKSLASPHGDEQYRGSNRPDERTPRCFYGNELTLGVILSIWLALQAFGSFGIGRAAEKRERRFEMFGTLQLIFSLTLPISAYLSRIFKDLMISMPGEAVGFGHIFTLLFSFFFLLRSPTGPFLPVGVSSGSRFRGHLTYFSCKGQTNRTSEERC